MENLMYAIFPFISLVFFFLIFLNYKQDWRESFLCAMLAWSVLLTVFTETLSLFDLFFFDWLLACWILTSSILVVVYFLKTDRKLKVRWSKISTSSALLLSGLAFIVLAVGLLAIMSPPNTDDSFTYHMGRVVHWIQNRNVYNYPTGILRQLYLTPWAEFAIANLQILSGGDRFANLVQWFSLVGSIVGVTLLARAIGADTGGQIFAAVIAGTIPMGILQGSSTQNDLVVSVWLVSFVYFAIIKDRDGVLKLENLLFASASLGLATLTKGTAYMYAFPFLIWFVLSQIKNFSRGFLKQAVIMSALVITINIGHYARNYDLFGTPLFPGEEHIAGQVFRNEVHSIPSIISNMSKYLSLHLETPSRNVNEAMEHGMQLLHNGLGVDIMDQRTTNSPTKEFKIEKTSFHEDTTGNTIHLLLITLAIALLLSNRGLREDKYLPKYLAAVAAGFLIYSFLLKWSPWSSRHHQPLFVLLSPFVAIVFLRRLSFKKINLIAVMLILAAMPWVFYNTFRPILAKDNIFNTSRVVMYFKYPELAKYLSAVKQVQSQNCTDIGVKADDSFFEYLFWILLNNNPDRKFRIEHVDVNNISATKYAIYPFNTFKPCLTVNVR